MLVGRDNGPFQIRSRRTNLHRRAAKHRRLGLRPERRYWLWLLFAFLVVFVTLIGAVTAAGAAAWYGYSKIVADLPSSDNISSRAMFKTATIYDRNGEVLYEPFDPTAGKRTIVHLDSLPPAIISATVATEDANFYSNPGFDPLAIIRALWQNLQGQTIESGASTITQQLVRNVLFSPAERYDQSYMRKLREVVIAYQLSQRYTKNQILEMYLNEVYYGNVAYGIEAAAENFFGKPATDLTLGEAALLAGLPQSPVDYNPVTNPQGALARQREVLGLMVRHGFISEADAAAAQQEQLHFTEPRYDIKAPHFSLYVRDLLERQLGDQLLYHGGLKIYTTLDLHLQAIAEQVVKDHIATLSSQNANDAALVAIDPKTGEVLAMVGSADYYNSAIDGQINMALAARQPGSTLKPFTYLLAFQRGLAPATVVLDRQMNFPNGPGQPPYQPHNHDGQFRGPVTLRQALANSLNIPAVQMLQFVGVPQLIDTLHSVGITTLNDPAQYGLALTLGGGEVRPLDLTFAYTVLANGGRQIGQPVPPADQQPGYSKLEPSVILRIEDDAGNVLQDYQPTVGDQLLSPQLTYMITDILSDDTARVGTYGRHSVLELSRPAAAKTGTTDDNRDAWTIGYTPDLVAGVWVGNADNRAMDNVFGASGAGVIWHDFMEQALSDHPPTPFIQPPGLVRGTVSALTGMRPSPGEPVVTDWFLPNNVPQQWSQPLIPIVTPTPITTTVSITTTVPLPTATPVATRIAPRAPTPPPIRVVPTPIAVYAPGVVPSVVGMTEADARKAIESAGLNTAYPNYQGPGDVPAGTLNNIAPGQVLSQQPAPGTILPPGAPVYLAIRKQ